MLKHFTAYDLFQVSPTSTDTQLRFSDNLDRLYITTPSFEPNLLLSDHFIDQSEGVIFVADNSFEETVPHLITYSETVRVYWRTTAQSTSRDSAAAGFRILTYPSSKLLSFFSL